MASMLVGMARTYLGVHTWSNVTAGWTLGYIGYRAERSLQVQSYWRPIWLVFFNVFSGLYKSQKRHFRTFGQ